MSILLRQEAAREQEAEKQQRMLADIGPQDEAAKAVSLQNPETAGDIEAKVEPGDASQTNPADAIDENVQVKPLDTDQSIGGESTATSTTDLTAQRNDCPEQDVRDEAEDGTDPAPTEDVEALQTADPDTSSSSVQAPDTVGDANTLSGAISASTEVNESPISNSQSQTVSPQVGVDVHTTERKDEQSLAPNIGQLRGEESTTTNQEESTDLRRTADQSRDSTLSIDNTTESRGDEESHDGTVSESAASERRKVVKRLSFMVGASLAAKLLRWSLRRVMLFLCVS